MLTLEMINSAPRRPWRQVAEDKSIPEDERLSLTLAVARRRGNPTVVAIDTGDGWLFKMFDE